MDPSHIHEIEGGLKESRAEPAVAFLDHISNFLKDEKVKEKNMQPHVLVVPWPAQGHINPMMHLSKKLAARGVMVTFANTQYNHERLLRAQKEAKVPLPGRHYINDQRNTHDSDQTEKEILSMQQQDMSINLVGIPDGLRPEDYIFSDVRTKCQALIDMEPGFCRLLQEELVDPPVSCIIADIFVISTPRVAKKLGIPHVGFWTQNAASYAAHVIFTGGYRPPKDELITCIPGCPPLRLSEVPIFLQPCDPSDFVFSYLIENFKAVHDSAAVLFNTLPDMEPAALAFIQEQPYSTPIIGPLLPDEFITAEEILDAETRDKMKLGTSLWPEEAEACMEWLDRQERGSVLYVSFGSIATLSARQIEEFAAGLEGAGTPTLMVVRPALMLAVDAAFPAGFAARMTARGRSRFVPWAPQLEVLAHPAVGGFLTHCGWNSVLESIVRGVPMLCWPFSGDQMLDCRCVVDGWKVGLEFDEVTDEKEATRSRSRFGSHLVSQHQIQEKVRFLMNKELSKDIRLRLQRLREAAKSAVKDGGPSRRSLDSFIDSLFQFSRYKTGPTYRGIKVG